MTKDKKQLLLKRRGKKSFIISEHRNLVDERKTGEISSKMKKR